MRALDKADEWQLILDLTFKPEWTENPETVSLVQKLGRKFGGRDLSGGSKNDVIVVHKGKEYVYPSARSAALNIPVPLWVIESFALSGRKTHDGYSFFYQPKGL